MLDDIQLILNILFNHTVLTLQQLQHVNRSVQNHQEYQYQILKKNKRIRTTSCMIQILHSFKILDQI